MTDIFNTLSTVFGLMTPLVGIIAIFKGSYKPQRITRFVSIIVNSISFSSLLILQSSSIWLAIPQFFGSFAFFVLCFKYGIGGQTKRDWVVFGLALALIIFRLSGVDTQTGLLLAICISALGNSVSALKCYRQPYTESELFYFTDVVSAIFSLLAIFVIGEFGFWILLYPMYILLNNGLCLGLIELGRRKKLKTKTP